MELSEIHNCEQSEGKIVCISIDILGITRCNYCNRVVDYSNYFKYQEAKRVLKELNKEVPLSKQATKVRKIMSDWTGD